MTTCHSNKRILSLDQSTTSTGYALYDEEKLVEYGVWRLKEKDILARIVGMSKKIHSYIIDQKVDIVVFEDTNRLQNTQTLKHLSMLMGSILYICEQKGKDWLMVLPGVWRSELRFSDGTRESQKRKRQKEYAKEYASNLVGVEIKNEDIAEAICIGSAFIKNQKGEDK